MTAVLDIAGLSVAYGAGPEVVSGVDLRIGPGESLGLVGESGSGKSTVAMAVMGHLGPGRVTSGRILLDGADITGLAEPAMRRLRGDRLAMVYQDPIGALNPTMRVGRQLAEAARRRDDPARAIREVLTRTRFPDPERILRRWPHELSGGQAQRIVIAMALLARPRLLILDEPTTGLDVTVEAEVTDLVAEIAAAGESALLYISHDLNLIAKVTLRVGVMQEGRIVEEGPVGEVLATPQHPYTRHLLDCLPRGIGKTAREGGTPPLVRLDRLTRVFSGGLFSKGPEVRAADGVSFHIGRGETVALIGESGSGKSTVARILIGLDTADGGTVDFDGQAIAQLPAGARPRDLIRRIRIVFQNPDGTLNPAHRVGRILARALKRAGKPRDAASVEALLALVRLPPETARRRPAALSGGQRQRVAIARAFAGTPDLVIADEPTSALDVSVQAAIVDLMGDVQQASGTAVLFISHDLALVRSIADRVVVLYQGKIVEEGPAAEIFAAPQHAYTKTLLAAAAHALTR